MLLEFYILKLDRNYFIIYLTFNIKLSNHIYNIYRNFGISDLSSST